MRKKTPCDEFHAGFSVLIKSKKTQNGYPHLNIIFRLLKNRNKSWKKFYTVAETKNASHFWGAMKAYTKEEKAFKCLNCGKIAYGRSDRKFCCQQCKNAWHNARTRESRLYRSRIITALGRNYNVLRSALERGELSIDLMTLQDRGFRPCYVTGHRSVRYGSDVCRCFDISYCQSASRVYRIRLEDED